MTEMNESPLTPTGESQERRAGVLDRAKEYVTKDRNTAYGEPEQSFSNIANLWNAYGVAKYGYGWRSLDSFDVTMMMCCLKMAGLATNPGHQGSADDLAGYAACAHDASYAPGLGVMGFEDITVQGGEIKGDGSGFAEMEASGYPITDPSVYLEQSEPHISGDLPSLESFLKKLSDKPFTTINPDLVSGYGAAGPGANLYDETDDAAEVIQAKAEEEREYGNDPIEEETRPDYIPQDVIVSPAAEKADDPE